MIDSEISSIKVIYKGGSRQWQASNNVAW